MRTFSRSLDRPIYHHLAFWTLVLACYLISNWNNYLTADGVLATYGSQVAVQVLVAYLCLGWLLPTYQRSRLFLPLLTGLLSLAFIGHTLLTMAKFFWLEPSYPYAFRHCLATYGDWTLTQRIFDLKYAFFISPVDVFLPGLALVTLQYYRKQQQISALKEQRKSAELSALKHQLNPHFLFNTLNNLYTLALKKSDQTATAIAKLSGILDHILYRCEQPFVPLVQEVELLESYLELEKLRYGDRVDIHFDWQVAAGVSIAPLLLLTFLENAFKHGVSQETARAKINISLRSSVADIDFRVVNSIPQNEITVNQKDGGIGLENVRQQLQLIYPNQHQLSIEQTKDSFTLQLRLDNLKQYSAHEPTAESAQPILI
ncbi:MAG: histidine kinase [Bacteroidota bacterium]